MQYTLEGRTFLLSKNTLTLLAGISVTAANRNIIDQLSRSVTSVGANYREANGASSRSDFRNKIHFCKKEIQETKYWIELLSVSETDRVEELRILWKESHELACIFGKISQTLNQPKKLKILNLKLF